MPSPSPLPLWHGKTTPSLLPPPHHSRSWWFSTKISFLLSSLCSYNIPQGLQPDGNFGALEPPQTSGFSPCQSTAMRAPAGVGTCPQALLSPQSLVLPGRGGKPAPAARPLPVPAAHPCASVGGHWAGQGGSPGCPSPTQHPGAPLPYPIDGDPGHILVWGVQCLGHLGVLVHQGHPGVPLHAGGDAATVHLRGVELQALQGTGDTGVVRGTGMTGMSPTVGHEEQGGAHTASRFLVTEVPDSRQKMTGK